MDNVNTLISSNLKRIRDERKLSLDNLAKISGVSKSMLGQIERGEANPTITTVWKIANGLKISFTELMNRPEAEVEIIAASEVEQFVEDNGRFRNFPLFPFDAERRFEVYYIEIDPQGRLEAEPHPENTQEFVTVFSGSLEIELGAEVYQVPNGSAIHFRADSPHVYRNISKDVCTISMVIYYPG